MASRRRRITVLCLAAIVVVAALLRLVNLDQHDLTDDEALYTFRGIGYIDTWFGSMRAPTELFATPPWWQPLSFHDHPPLATAVQHLFLRTLGSTILVARLPFALAGVASVLLMYGLANALGSRRYALAAAALLAVVNYHVWISRVAFIESLLLLWMLLALYWLVRALDDARLLPWVGVAVGLSLITKYPALILLPVVPLTLGRFRPQLLSWRHWSWAGIVLLVLTPVIIYNGMLFASRGHFDASLWAMLGQRHEDFATDDRGYASSWGHAVAWLRWLPQGFDAVTLGLAVGGLVLLVGKQHTDAAAAEASGRRRFVVLAYLVCAAVFLSLSPGRKQNVALVIPAVVLAAAVALEHVAARLHLAAARWLAVGALVLVPAVVTVNSQLRSQPRGGPSLVRQSLRPTSYAYHALDAYLDDRYRHEPIAKIPFTVPQYQAYQERSYQARVAAGAQAGFPPFLIWDERFDYAATRWSLLRRPFYLHQPMVLSEEADRFFKAYSVSKLEELGYRQFIFAFAEPPLLAGTSFSPHRGIAAAYRQLLDQRGAQPRVLYDRFNVPQFAIYETSTLAFLTEYSGPLGDAAVPVE